MASIQASSLSIGTSVYLKYNNSYQEFLVIQQGNPNSGMYDSSCNGTWLVKTTASGTSFTMGHPNYNQSNLVVQQNSDFYLFGEQEQSAIKTVKIPWVNQTGNLYTGNNGLQVQVFTLSVCEMFENVSNYINADGLLLDYFESYSLDNFPVPSDVDFLWTRTIDYSDGNNDFFCYYNDVGSFGADYINYTHTGSYQPTIIIPSTTLFDSSTMRLAIDNSGNNNTSSNTTYKVGDVLNYEYTGSIQSITLPAGTYKLECWGAQGGYYTTAGGLGGYSYGTLNLKEETKLYIRSGGSPSNGTSRDSSAGWNGGGSSAKYGGGGGGASDIRIGTDSTNYRVIVAGGGGGAGYSDTSGGYGGGTTGGQGGNGSTTGGYGGSQTSGGSNNVAGSFGQGGNSSAGGGGGGGWYGGASGASSSVDSGGGGGSGFVYTKATSSNNLSSIYYLIDAGTNGGNTNFIDYSGSSVTGHSGNGACRITILKLKSTSPIIKINSSTWNENTEMFIKINSTTWEPVDTIYIKTSNGWKEGG